MSINKELLKKIDNIDNEKVRAILMFVLQEVGVNKSDNSIKSALKSMVHLSFEEEQKQ